ncbi:NmrA family protein [Beutenbergia cavernae DSM 12333]|uniref:NmrA family protein n=1 Tax=Beutenbergia cavernae (strain ATCC BAA-8 / DSM 12333 / CCUG 43141 / JCM 11478 / NBRC 16432 / NCIMB 13614 / HKI 0122) TaxID=471853 RepID=C5BXP6_BEUC1|nr:NAD(P)H-binding protein [Beutenbergia cavernae]ACQ80929.1 NmrA family protein [Beutenbergia cavernae DSM 12333]
MTILVTGATGTVGRLVVDALLDRGATDVRALTIDPVRAALPAGVDVAIGSVLRPETLRGAFDGVRSFYLAPHPPTTAAVMAVAVSAGVERVVDLAGAEGTGWETIEPPVEESGLGWTHLEPGEFMENATIWAEQIRERREVRDAFPSAANAPIAMADVADAAAACLLDETHAGRRYTLTGPETLTSVEKVRVLGDAIGAPVTFVEVPRADAIAQLEASMGEYAEWYVDGYAALVEHPQAAVPALSEVLGRPATTFAQWARANAAAFT